MQLLADSSDCFELSFPFDAVDESKSWVEHLYSEVQPALSEAKQVSVSSAFEQIATVEMLLLKRFGILDEASEVRLQLPGEAAPDKKDSVVINVPLNPRLFGHNLQGGCGRSLGKLIPQVHSPISVDFAGKVQEEN